MIKHDKELIVVGDRVLVRCRRGRRAHERRSVSAADRGRQSGRAGRDDRRDRSRASHAESGFARRRAVADVAERPTRFVPMQAKKGDYALFFRKAAVEITFEGDRYLVVPQAAILALVRDE